MDAGEYWQRRFEQYDSQARSLLVRTVEIVSIGLTVLGAVMGLAISSSHQEALAFIPPVVLLLWAVAARFIDEQLLACAYRDYAELQAARVMGVGADGLASWWATGAPKAQKGFVNFYLFAVLATLSIVLIVGSLYAFAPYAAGQGHLFTAGVIAIILMGALAVVAFLTALKHHKDARQPVEMLMAELRATVGPSAQPDVEAPATTSVGSSSTGTITTS